MTDDTAALLKDLAQRYRDAPASAPALEHAGLLRSMAARASCRAFTPQPVPERWLDILCAIALASPSKSDLQQRDIIALHDPDLRARVSALVSGQSWVADAPMILIFCGNNRRQRHLHDWHDLDFANDHLDAFFNAAGDAAIALASFVTAAEAIGLGCCPISAVRNEASALSEMLNLPDHVFPFAGLAVGFPAEAGQISKRLPLSVTCHRDRYCEDGLQAQIADYDAHRENAQPYAKQRDAHLHGTSAAYGWSEDKARQYHRPERADFGAFVRAKGFRLD